jgi:hypothetical protein
VIARWTLAPTRRSKWMKSRAGRSSRSASPRPEHGSTVLDCPRHQAAPELRNSTHLACFLTPSTSK